MKTMLLNYLKIALRNFLKQKAFSFINIFGLAVGLACCLLMCMFVVNELSYDRHNLHAERIYRLCFHGRFNENEMQFPFVGAPVASTFAREFPEIEQAARMYNTGSTIVRYGDVTFKEYKQIFADSNIFEIFTIPFILGDSKTALNAPIKLL